MSLGSRGSSSQSNPTTTAYNLGLQEIEGPAVANVGGSTNILTTDQGAVDAGRDIALEALAVGERNFDVVSAGLELALDRGSEGLRAGLDAGADAQAGALRFAGEVFDASRASLDANYDRSLAFANEASSRAFASADDSRDAALAHSNRAFDAAADSYNTARGDVLGLVENVIDVVRDTGAEYQGAIERFQARESGNTDARLEGITSKVLYLGGAVAVVGLLVAVYSASQKRAA
jgi:hypothetical protein